MINADQGDFDNSEIEVCKYFLRDTGSQGVEYRTHEKAADGKQLQE